jgi:predicted nucleic acid-binding protein
MAKNKLGKGSVVYLDANFLVAYGAKKTRQPAKQTSAKRLMAQLLVGKCRLTASPLVFDEAWMAIRNESAAPPTSSLGKLKLYSSPLFRKIGMKFVNYSQDVHPFITIMGDVRRFTSLLIGLSVFEVVQFQDGSAGVTDALSRLNEFKPRDAFHVAFALENGATHIVTNDKRLARGCKGQGLLAIDF